MIIKHIWDTTPEELRRLADKLDAACKPELWGEDRVVETITSGIRVQLDIAIDNDYWIKRI